MARHRDDSFAIYGVNPELIAVFDIFPLGRDGVFPPVFEEITQTALRFDFIQDILSEVRPVRRCHDEPGLRHGVAFIVCRPMNLSTFGKFTLNIFIKYLAGGFAGNVGD